MIALLAALLACRGAGARYAADQRAPQARGAMTAPEGYAVRAAYTLVPGPDRMSGRIDLLEDARIQPSMRTAISEAWGGDPCVDNPVPVLAPLCDVSHRTALRPALLRLLDATGRVVASDTLERPLADLGVANLYGSARSSYKLTVDLTAGIGTYSGPYTRFAEPDSDAFGWVMDVDTFGRAPDTLTLVSTPKTAWRAVPRADGRGLDFLMVLCRPDFEAPDSAADSLRFLLTFERFTFDGRRWERRRRQEHGCWESRDSSDFPARTRFP